MSAQHNGAGRAAWARRNRTVRTIYFGVRRAGWATQESAIRCYRALRRKLPARLQAHLPGHGMYSLSDEDQVEPLFEGILQRLVDIEGGSSELGDYLEFGVFFGASMACMHRASSRVGARHMRLVGFDSFEGLPAETEGDSGDAWAPGQFRADERVCRAMLTRAGIDWQRTVLVKGWFSDTLTPDLVTTLDLDKVSVVMIDSDIYASATQALAFCGPLLADTSVIVFDDWHSFGLSDRNLGEKRAFDEFLGENPSLRATDIGTYTRRGAVSGQVFLVERRPETTQTS